MTAPLTMSCWAMLPQEAAGLLISPHGSERNCQSMWSTLFLGLISARRIKSRESIKRTKQLENRRCLMQYYSRNAFKANSKINQQHCGFCFVSFGQIHCFLKSSLNKQEVNNEYLTFFTQCFFALSMKIIPDNTTESSTELLCGVV